MKPALTTLAAAVLLAGCSTKPVQGDDQPTLKSLAGREVSVTPDAPGATAAGGEEQAIAAYRRFLDAAPNAPQRPQAMRRLGDLAMESADSRTATTGADPDYKAAIQRYRDYLKAYPNAADNDRVLYQLARAHEQAGDLDTALQMLDRLVREYPATAYRDEAQFRRGELLFTKRQYAAAEQAYALVLKGDSDYRERALYMHGWSVYKQGRLEDALASFFGVLDAKFGALDASADEASDLETIEGLSRAERELVEDTFRVVSLSLDSLKGAEAVPAFVDAPAHAAARARYEFRVYQQLSALYLKQERPKDAADALNAFARKRPLHVQAPQMQARAIEIHEQAGFNQLALESKKEYVGRYGIDSEFRRANPEGWARAQPLLKTHLTELARHHHAAAQKSKTSADVQEAVRWYRALLAAFPQDADASRHHFLLAELLYEDKQYAAAAAEYETAAYRFPAQPHSAEAGYAALLAYNEQIKPLRAGGNPTALSALQRQSVDSSLRFAERFPADPRSAQVLTTASEQLYALGDGPRAAGVAQQVLALQPPAAPALRKVAWTVTAHQAFEQRRYADAERAYTEVLALTDTKDAARADLVERQAAAIYKQGEQAREAGQMSVAAGHFARVAAVAPQSTVRTAAQYDAGAALIAMKDWAGAARTLEDFRQRYPQHPLSEDVAAKLALAYTEQGQWANAAAEYERLAATRKDAEVARSAQWQAAELFEKAATAGSAGARVRAAQAYERYLRQYPAPLEQAMEARARLVAIAQQDGNKTRALALQREIFQADQAGGAARTGRTRTLGAMAALALAEPARQSYAEVRLVEPLKKTLATKKTRLEEALKAYNVAAEYGVAEVVTASTYQIGTLYQDFGKALIGSQRPKKLSKLELEQYNVLLEEQAFPFEEKAIELHELNALRSADGLYDEWVQKSFGALRELRPGRWAKTEREDGAGHRAGELTRQGLAARRQGDFATARTRYEAALAADAAYAPALLNLGVLNDLYLNRPAEALALYDRYLALVPGGDPVVTRWVADVKKRAPAGPAAPASGAAPAASGTSASQAVRKEPT